MQQAPKSLRLQIAILGRTNAGKSSFLNLVTGQQTAITSPQPGTTTDVVEKAQELPPLGPVLWLDTAGLDDTTALAPQRLEKTYRTLDRADIAVLIYRNTLGMEEQQIIAELDKRKIPYLKVFNQENEHQTSQAADIILNATNLSARNRVLNELTAALIKICPEDYLQHTPLVGDLLPPDATAVMIVPIDYEAPKGRLIMPQVQAIRDCLDHNQNILVVKEDNYAAALENFKTPPALVICDSQVVDKMVSQTPPNIKCTTFSILMARFKGDLLKMTQGAAIINRLQNGDKVLIAESCTHHPMEDDIGRVKIPRWLQQKTGKTLDISHVCGCDFITNLSEYKLVIQCGGCTINRREILSRIQKCEAAGVAITNYGVCISELKGVLKRVLEPFDDVYQAYCTQINKP